MDSINEFINVANDSLLKHVRSAPRPDRLFHFTDCEGLIGILKNRSLWASLATSLNDQSEIEYGLGRARSLLQAGATNVRPDFLHEVERYLDIQNAIPLGGMEFYSFIISMCARVDRSVHWLHYGRSGTGFAIGFDAKVLEKDSFMLVPVIYDEAQQDDLLRCIIESVWNRLDQPSNQDSNGLSSTLITQAAYAVAGYIWAALPLMKNPVFANEEEWRLFTTSLEIHIFVARVSLGSPGPMSFRSVNGRLVPYKELVFDELPITDIVIGASVPMASGDPAIGMLLHETMGDKPIKVTRSTVPVRL